uniref:FAS1 domain-containing protein n=1 Tax=Ananas comosus var. bracteatus TaxID=296719 RepID=A0A6V7NZJ9_ANACO|nr:unnamed protein product [Ananas comosus var. bracteatus]
MASTADVERRDDEDTGAQVAPIVKLEEVVVPVRKLYLDAEGGGPVDTLRQSETRRLRLRQWGSGGQRLGADRGRMRKESSSSNNNNHHHGLHHHHHHPSPPHHTTPPPHRRNRVGAKLGTAPGSSAGVNLTEVLEKGGQYTTLIRLLKETQLDLQINSQLRNSFNGLTVFAPTDNAFGALKAGTLNALSPQEQVALVLYHVLPAFYSLEMFQTASNPVRTQASGNDGAYTLNITSVMNQVNVSTGIVETSITNTLVSTSRWPCTRSRRSCCRTTSSGRSLRPPPPLLQLQRSLRTRRRHRLRGTQLLLGKQQQQQQQFESWVDEGQRNSVEFYCYVAKLLIVKFSDCEVELLGVMKIKVLDRKEELEEESENDSEEDNEKKKGTQGIIEIENPNLAKPKMLKAREADLNKTAELSRREREEIEKQKAHERYMRLQEQGKTEQAKKDLERLALIRQQRAEAAKKTRGRESCQRTKED